MQTLARRGEAGFSFVELLVTIIIAGVAFAAMVPLFVQAQKTMSGDQVRNAALQLAQDKMEKVRALDYDLITADNLNSATFASGQFGTTVNWSTGGGGSRTFTVAYAVDLVPTGSAPGKESYKQVTVTVSWTAPPAPVKPVVLSTMVSKQYAGPQIVRFDIGPPDILSDVGGGSWAIVSGPVVIDAYIAPDDIASMNQGAAEDARGYVLFSVASLNGLVSVQQKVTSPLSSGEPARYQFTWDNSAAPDGVYVFQAVAYAGFGSRAQGMPVSLALQYTNHAPPAPTDITATPGDSVVYLQWGDVGAGDVDHYEVWRSADDGITYVKIGEPATASFEDSGLVNGTTYRYKLRTVDAEGLVSPYSTEVLATPELPQDTVPPSVPAPLTAEALPLQPTVRLTWAASTDDGDPTSGLAGYVIERSADQVTWSTLQSMYEATTYDDVTAGYATTWWYRVKAVDNAANSSAWAGPVSATTGAKVVRTITVRNNSSTQTYVWVQDVATLLWYATNGTSSSTRPTNGVWVKKNGNSVTWTNLPPATYNVYFLSSSTWNEAKRLKTQVVDVTGGNGTATYP